MVSDILNYLCGCVCSLKGLCHNDFVVLVNISLKSLLIGFTYVENVPTRDKKHSDRYELGVSAHFSSYNITCQINM